MQVGSKVKVIANKSSHGFNIGDIVTITNVYQDSDGRNNYTCEDDSDYWYLYAEEFELIINQTNSKMTSNQVMKDATLAVATDLLKANNTVTTLEVKTELRKAFPHFRWKQHTDVSTGVPGVSELMAELEVDGELAFTDSGLGYRIYSLAGVSGVAGTTGITIPTPVSTTTSTATANIINVPTAKKVKKTPTKAKSISKAKALDLIQNSKGHFFKVVFIKKEDGKERTLNGQYVKGQTVSPLGLVRVKESSLMKKLKKTGDINTIPSKSVIRSFNINNLKTLGIAGQNYKIRK